MTTFQTYASYYDLLYHEKNYNQEAAYVDELIKQYAPQARTMLDLGCGTGKHACALAHLGYTVHGVDLSTEMLHHAGKTIEADQYLGARVSFSQGDARKIELTKTFDVVVSLFHVMSYQVSNHDVKSFFQTITKHLKPGGLIVIDFWYGPAVLTEKPETRVKRVKREAINLTRITEPELNIDTNSVSINFSLLVEDKQMHNLLTIKETHEMRYFFKPEILALFDEFGIELLTFEAWLTGKEPSISSRDVCVVGRKR